MRKVIKNDKKILLKIMFRLRNEEEFLIIEKNFKKNGYVIDEFEEISKRNFEIQSIYKKISELKLKYGINCKIVLISNIKDLLFCSYRIYNSVIDNFVFFIDKINYNVLENELYKKLANFNNIEEEELKGKIYFNIEFKNFINLFDFLMQFYNFTQFDNIENFKYDEIIKRNEEIKKYIYNEEEYLFFEKENIYKNILISNERESIDSRLLYEMLDKNIWFIVFYVIGLYRKYDIKIVREFTVSYFSYLKDKKTDEKHKIAEIIYSTKGIAFLEFKEKVAIFSLFTLFELPVAFTSAFIIKAMIDGENGSEKYYPSVLLDILHYMNRNNLILYKDIRKDLKIVMNRLKKYYIERCGKIETNNYNGESKKIAFIVDGLQNKNYSISKFTFALVKNILKYSSEYKIKIFTEDNFNTIEEEDILLYTITGKYKGSGSFEHRLYHEKEFKDKEVEFVYSDITKPKDVRTNGMLEMIKKYNPEIILTHTLCSQLTNILYDEYPVVYISMGGENYGNDFDVQLYNHYEQIIDKMKRMGETKHDTIYKFKYGVEFEKGTGLVYNREKFNLKKEDFVMVTVGVRLRQELQNEYLKSICEYIKENKNIKWYLVGEREIPFIEENYKELIKNKIFFINYESNLLEFYKLCDVYINPPRTGGGYSMGEAMINGVPVVSMSTSNAGKYYVGEEDCVNDLDEYIKKIEIIRNDIEEKKRILEREIKNMENYDYKGAIERLIPFFQIAKDRFFKRKNKEI